MRAYRCSERLKSRRTTALPPNKDTDKHDRYRATCLVALDILCSTLKTAKGDGALRSVSVWTGTGSMVEEEVFRKLELKDELLEITTLAFEYQKLHPMLQYNLDCDRTSDQPPYNFVFV